MKTILAMTAAVLACAALSAAPVDKGFAATQKKAYEALDAGDWKAAQPLLEAVAAHPKAKAQDAFTARVLLAWLAAKDDTKALRKAVLALKPLADAAGKEGETAAAKDERYIDWVRDASQVLFVRLFDQRAVEPCKALVALTMELLQPEERVDYTVRFVDRLPQTAEGAALTDLIDRLPKDNRMRRRAAYSPPRAFASGSHGHPNQMKRLKSAPEFSLKADDPGYEGSFCAACDANGLHIYVRSGNPDAWKIAAGLENGYNYEYSIQPGGLAPSHFMFGKARDPQNYMGIEWDTPRPGYRLTQDGIKTDVYTAKDYHMLHIYVPWIMFTQAVPKDGDTWRVTVAAGASKHYGAIGGAASHEVGHGAQMHFKLSGADVRKIRLGVLRQAVGEFLAKRRQWETADFWDDPHMGDPKFYAEAVKPFLADADAAAKAFVSAEKEPTDAELEELVRTRLPQWAEFTLQVDALREKYVKNALFAE